MAECHISISKLTDFYCETGRFNTKILALIILFRFYYTQEVDEGLAEVSALLRNKITLEIIKDQHIQTILNICRIASDGNYYTLLYKAENFNEMERILINLIAERSRKSFTLNLLKSYPLVSVSWIKTLLNIDGDSIKVQEFLKEETGQLIELNELRDKFILKKLRKQQQ